jgi:hypothetical protein
MVDHQLLSTGTYVLGHYALSDLITDREREYADEMVNPEYEVVEEITKQLQLNKQYEAAALFFTTTASSNNTTLTTNQWDYDTTTSNPIEDADTAILTIMKAIGSMPNNIVMGQPTFRVLKDHAEILDRVKWSQVGFITEDLIASALGIPNLSVANTAGQTLADGISATSDFLFNSKALIFYSDPNPGKYVKSFGVCFTGSSGESAPQVDNWREPSLKGDMYEVNWAYQMKIVLSLAGYVIAGTNS